MTEVFIGLGSNLGNRSGNIENALELIGRKAGRVRELSSFVESEPWGYLSENWFLNRVAVVDFDDSQVLTGNRPDDRKLPESPAARQAMELLHRLRAIENSIGRIRTGRYIDRLIDLDILYYGNAVIETAELTIPHPDIHKRKFILVSLMELCPEKVHPGLGLTIRELMERCTDEGRTRIITGPDFH